MTESYVSLFKMADPKQFSRKFISKPPISSTPIPQLKSKEEFLKYIKVINGTHKTKTEEIQSDIID